MSRREEMSDPPVVTGTEKETLLRVARETLVRHLTDGGIPSYTVTEPGLLQEAAAFVTLRQRNGQLRGCIGRVEATDSLLRTVENCAISAATRDYRFSPVAELAELDELIIEISVLSPFRRISSPEEIEVGRHGLLIRQGMQSGLLLPQVASDRSWSRDEFLQAICVKADLPPDAWHTAELSVFRAEVFEED